LTLCAHYVNGNGFGEDKIPMVQNNKVLTVSYGTFSCTLEGFEDSFDTMKAIAEYFRDLASDDRYFGAEPPQPDAEMLTRIAQREIDRQVEARTSDGAVHLRATAPPPEGTVVSVPADPVAAEVEAPEQAVEDEAPEQAVEAEVEAPVVEAASAAAVPVTEELSEAPAEEVSQTPAEDPASLTAEQVSAEVAPVAVETAPEAETPEPAEQLDDGLALAAVAAAVAAPETTELPPVEDIAVTEVADAGDDTVPAADSIAAKLQRIRAVVARAPRDEEFSEDEHAELFISESAVDIAAAMRLDDEAEQAAEEESQDQDEIAIALDRIDQRQTDTSDETSETKVEVEPEIQVEAEVEPEVEVVAEVEPEVEITADVEPEVEVTAEAEPEVDVTAETEAEVEITGEDTPEVEEPSAEVSDDDDSLFEDLEDSSSNKEADAPDEDANILAEVAKHTSPAEATSEEAETKPPLRARIVRVKRADVDRALESGALEEIVDEVSEQTPETSLSDADEADLLRELAAVEAELLAGDESAETPEELEETDSPEAEIDAVEEIAEEIAAASTRPAAETLDSDVSRLMAAADEKLEDPETSSSRETYDHLRAAMAAAQADRAAGGSVGSGVRDEAYREDLASVVRPRRPAAAKSNSRRPAPATRPAPLKLVAEQRIDEAPAKPSGPVRPRRIASSQAEEAEFADKGRVGGFADYATECGAAELHELLEAAASYMSFIEGRDHFSRPQLMNKVKQLDSAEFNREDGLRSFGQLLREGKIEKTSNGQFTVSGQIGFRPGERAAS